MVRTRLVRRYNEIVDLHVERIRNTYPIYTIEYREKLHAATTALNRYENLLMLGRTGTFWYNNMDHSIRQALDLAATVNGDGNLASWREQIMNNRDL